MTAEVLANQRIVGRGALREVRHVEHRRSPGLGNFYQPGDALGIVHRNPDAAIDAVLKATKMDGAATVTHDGKTHTLHEWLRDERELTRIARPLLQQVAKQANADITQLLGNADAMAKLTANCQVSDVLASYPAEWTPEALVAALRPCTAACTPSLPAPRPSAMKRISPWRWSAATPIASCCPARRPTTW